MGNAPHWLQEKTLQQFFAATHAAGGEARVVGGAVRDFLLGREGGDVDVASSLKPEDTMAIAAAAGWKAVPTGIAHGTVTLVLPERVVEVTTLRRDVETDGRHATVAYTDDFAEDAARRDFTMNALSMDAQGSIHDYYRGREDIDARQVRFIGDAATRIAEDGLRILRYFRFMAQLGFAGDAQALAACEAQRAMVANLSGERIAQEMRKLLVAAAPAEALGQMAGIGLPEYLTESPWYHDHLLQLLALEKAHDMAPSAWVRLLAMIAPEFRTATASWIGERWKLSRNERALLAVLAGQTTTVDAATTKEWLRAHERAVVQQCLLLWAVDTGEDVGALLRLAQTWNVPALPVTAKDLIARGHSEGRALGDALRALEERWIKSDYTLSKAELLA